MENSGWLQTYLAPLGIVGQAQAAAEGAASMQSQHSKRQGGANSQSSRTVLSDISNNASNSRPEVSKEHKPVNAAVRAPSAGPHHEFSQQNFSDPSLIDGAHADKKRRGWIDVDALNLDDPQACSAYAPAIFQHLQESEVLRRANPAYLEQFQTDVNSKMRAILVDWLVEVAEEYKLCADTLYLTVNYIDRLLSVHPVQRSQLQLVGVACMWVASKYEEIYPPNVTDFCYITDNTYSKEQLVHMEETVLKMLKYELTVPTAKTFLRRLLQVCNPDEHLHFLSNYLTELSLLDHAMMEYLPSQVAAAAVYLANLMLKRSPWDGNLLHYSTYGPSDIARCVHWLAALHQTIAGNSQLGAIRDKYGHPRFQSVSKIHGVTQIYLNQHLPLSSS